MPVRPPRYAGFEGLYRADAVELATEVFLHVFSGATVGTPVRDGGRVDEIVAWLAGVPRVASTRTTAGDHTRSFCCLLRLGEHVLGSADPQRTMRELLDGVELR